MFAYPTPITSPVMAESWITSPNCSTLGLLSLPDELKLEIVNHLHLRRDLLSLCLTCRTLEDIVMAKLYAKISVEIPQSRTMRWNIAGLPVFRSDVIRSMRSITIWNGVIDMRDPVYSRRQRSDAGSVEGYMCDILRQVPHEQLASFSFLHRSPMAFKVLEVLGQSHNANLRELRFYELEAVWNAATILPQNLSVLECRSIHEGATVGKIVESSKNTLEVLRLGREKGLVERYRQSRIRFLDQTAQPMDSFASIMTLRDLPNLREVAFFGLDVESLVPESISDALLFCQLNRLTLESCNGSTEFLESIAGTFHYAQSLSSSNQKIPQLKEFLFRHEAPSTQLKASLNRFLASFSGLETLSMLFENATFLERPSTLINGHGPALKTLVLECRIQPRENLGLDTSRPFGVGGYTQALWEDSINDICSLCPNLEELGMGFPWSEDIVRLRKTSLPTLKKLHTIHIRNFPESQFLSRLGDYSIKEYARKFVEWVFPALIGGSRPALETLALGPTLYETRWKLTSSQRQTPEFLRTHYYCLDWAKTRFGRWSPMITNVGEKCIEELRDESPLKGVFEQVWLR